jgi:dTDP-D-glucose 4,6-dehydratase
MTIIKNMDAHVVNNIYNIAGGFEQENIITVKKIIKEYFKKENYSSSYIDTSFDRKGQDVRYALNDDKLRLLGWKPKKVFDDELPLIVEYYKDRFIW